MKKNHFTKFINNDFVKLATVIIAAIFLITISIILFDDIQFDNRILIFAIFGTVALAGFLYSFALTRKNVWIRLSFGITRKEIYKNYLKNSLIALLISIFLAAYYMVIYNLVYFHQVSIAEVFDLREVVFLPLIYLILSFLGFFLGIFKMNRSIFYSLAVFIIVCLVLIIIYYTITNWLNYTLLGFAILFGGINYLLFMKYKL